MATAAKPAIPEGPKPSTATAVPIAPTANLNPLPTPGPAPKPPSKRPAQQDFTFTVKNHAALEALNKRFKPEIDTAPVSSEPPRTSWFEKMKISRQVSTDDGPPFIIDVQPDFRNPLAYILSNIDELYPALDVKPAPYISPMTLAYYNMSLLVASLLINDLYIRDVRSHHAASYMTISSKCELADILMHCRVPSFMVRILNVLAPAYDAQKTGLLYIPTLAGFSYMHDIARMVPPRMFLVAHNLLASARVNTPVHEILHEFYSAIMYQINGAAVQVTKLIGGPFTVNGEVHQVSNWIRDRIETTFNPVVARNLANRPTLARTATNFPNWLGANDVNPYDLMLGYTASNEVKLMNILSALSTFTERCEPSAPQLGAVIQASTGITIMSHYITQPTLPTAHNFGPPAAAQENIPEMPLQEYADEVHFLADLPIGDGNVEVPAQLPLADFFVNIRRADFALQNRPVDFIPFDVHRNVAGEILTFQPYDRQTSSLAFTLTLGLTIENGDIDGITIGVPNPLNSLVAQHGQYLQGSVPLALVRDYLPSNADADILRIMERHLPDEDDNAVGIARRDMSRNVIPIFDNQHIHAPNRIYGFQQLQHIDDNQYAYTYAAWRTNDNRYPIPNRSLYLWSSYRHVLYPNNAARKQISMYATMKGLYGNAVNMCALKHFTKILPK